MSQLRINVGLRPRKSKSVSGYRGSLESLRKQVTALVTHERLELVDTRAATVRQYTEKLISDAVLYGDKHKHTMEMAQWWLENVSFQLENHFHDIFSQSYFCSNEYKSFFTY